MSLWLVKVLPLLIIQGASFIFINIFYGLTIFAFALIRGLRMLSLVLGADITDASVASIASSYPNLELLDLSGYAHLVTSYII